MRRDAILLIGGQAFGMAASLVGLRLISGQVDPSLFGSVMLLIGVAQLGEHAFAIPMQQTTMRFYAEAVEAGPGVLSALRRIAYASLNRLSLGFWSLVLVGAMIYLFVVDEIVMAGHIILHRLGVLGTDDLIAFLIGSILELLSLSNASVEAGPLAFLAVTAYGVLLARNELERSLFSAAERYGCYVAWVAFEAAGQPLAILGLIALFGADPFVILMGYIVTLAVARFLFWPLLVRESSTANANAPDTSDAPTDSAPTSVVAPDPETLRERTDAFRAEYHRFILPMVSSGSLNWVNRMSDRYLIGAMLGLDAAGVYTAVYNLLNRGFTQFNLVLSRLFNPKYFRMTAKGNDIGARRVMSRWVWGQFGLGVLACLGIWGLAGPITRLMLDPRFIAQSPIDPAVLIPWIVIGQLARIQNAPQRTTLMAQNRPQAVLWGRVAGAIVAIGVTIPAIAVAGLVGAAAACPLYYGIQLIIYHVLIRQDRSRQPGSHEQVSERPVAAEPVTGAS